MVNLMPDAAGADLIELEHMLTFVEKILATESVKNNTYKDDQTFTMKRKALQDFLDLYENYPERKKIIQKFLK